jgi:hypothetical protein
MNTDRSVCNGFLSFKPGSIVFPLSNTSAVIVKYLNSLGEICFLN